METKAVVKKATSTAIKFGAATAGLAAGHFVAGKIPSFGPPVVQKILPGLVVMLGGYLIAQKVNHDAAESAGIGMGIAGFANIVKGFFPAVGAQIPLNGIAGFGQPSPDQQLLLNGPAPEALMQPNYQIEESLVY